MVIFSIALNFIVYHRVKKLVRFHWVAIRSLWFSSQSHTFTFHPSYYTMFILFSTLNVENVFQIWFQWMENEKRSRGKNFSRGLTNNFTSSFGMKIERKQNRIDRSTGKWNIKRDNIFQRANSVEMVWPTDQIYLAKGFACSLACYQQTTKFQWTFQHFRKKLKLKSRQEKRKTCLIFRSEYFHVVKNEIFLKKTL